MRRRGECDGEMGRRKADHSKGKKRVKGKIRLRVAGKAGAGGNRERKSGEEGKGVERGSRSSSRKKMG